MKNVEIHGIDPVGNKYVLNHLSQLNVELGGPHGREQLLKKATTMAGAWRQYFPHDVINVVQVKVSNGKRRKK